MQHLDGAVLCNEVFSHSGVLSTACCCHSGYVVHPNAFRFLCGQSVGQLSKQHGGLSIDYIYDGLKDADRKICVLGHRVQLKKQRALNYLAHLLMDVDVGGSGGPLWYTNPETPAP